MLHCSVSRVLLRQTLIRHVATSPYMWRTAYKWHVYSATILTVFRVMCFPRCISTESSFLFNLLWVNKLMWWNENSLCGIEYIERSFLYVNNALERLLPTPINKVRASQAGQWKHRYRRFSERSHFSDRNESLHKMLLLVCTSRRLVTVTTQDMQN